MQLIDVFIKKNSHYSCSIKIDKTWYLFDDQKVQKKQYPDTIYSENVVGLFYIREI